MYDLDIEQLEVKAAIEASSLGGAEELQAALLAKTVFSWLMDNAGSVAVARRVPQILSAAMSIKTTEENAIITAANIKPTIN